MPILFSYGGDFLYLIARRKRAEAAVLAKYPNIIVGSSGWNRAVEARLRKV